MKELINRPRNGGNRVPFPKNDFGRLQLVIFHSKEAEGDVPDYTLSEGIAKWLNIRVTTLHEEKMKP